MDVEKIYKNPLFLVLLAIGLSVVLQSLFLLNIKDNPNLYFNGNFIPLWTHDSGLYGFYAKELISGANLPFTSEYMPGWLLYGMYKITPFSLDQLMFFSPVVISSFVIIPIFGIFALFNLQRVGFFAGVLTTISFGYYYRSFFGYFDTDILNLFFPLMVTWGLIGYSSTNNRLFILLSALSMLGFSLWYHSYIAVGASIVLMWSVYTFIFQREHLNNYLIIIILAIPFLHVNFLIELITIFCLFAISYQTFFTKTKYIPYIFLALLIIGAFFIDFNLFVQRAGDYIEKVQYTKLANLSFLNTLSTVSEAVKVDIDKFSMLVSSNLPLALVGLFGFVLLSFKHRQFLLILPLGFVGFLSLIAGERFVLYGIVVFSFGLVYIGHELSSGFAKYQKSILTIFMAIISYFYLQEIISFSKYKKPVFNQSQMQTLSKLPKNKDNFILTWWDYGWPLWYTTDAKTLIDNGKHFEDNYIISKLLFSTNQNLVANASKQSVKLFKEGRKKGHYKLMSYLLKNRSLNEALKLLKTPSESKTPVYWYLNNRLLKVANVIETFSNIDPKGGKQKNASFLAYIYNTKYNSFDSKNGIFSLQKGKLHVKTYINTQTKKTKNYEKNGIYLIQNKTHFFICDENIYNSFLVQALLLHNVDEKLFQIISYDDTSMLIKVK